MKSHKNQNNKQIMGSKPTDVAKSATTRKPKNLFSIHPDLDMALDKATPANVV